MPTDPVQVKRVWLNDHCKQCEMGWHCLGLGLENTCECRCTGRWVGASRRRQQTR